jgi:hypothetical protein
MSQRLPVKDARAVELARRDAAARPLDYPVGSGQGEELALAAGLRPMIRQLLSVRVIEGAARRFARFGFVTGVVPRVYGPTHDGWDETLESFDAADPGARQAMFVGRDRAQVEEAVAREMEKSDDDLGRLLGYPRCCTEAFLETSRQRRNMELYAAALGRTRGRCHPRLNGLDFAVFHYISWSPCSFDCPLSIRYADAVAARLTPRHGAFVEGVDRALGAGRLVLLDEVQLSIRGRTDEAGIHPDQVWATARDRHPSVPLDPGALEAVARALALVRGASRLAVSDEGLRVDGELIDETPGALWVPFGESVGERASGP